MQPTSVTQKTDIANARIASVIIRGPIPASIFEGALLCIGLPVLWQVGTRGLSKVGAHWSGKGNITALPALDPLALCAARVLNPANHSNGRHAISAGVDRNHWAPGVPRPCQPNRVLQICLEILCIRQTTSVIDGNIHVRDSCPSADTSALRTIETDDIANHWRSISRHAHDAVGRVGPPIDIARIVERGVLEELDVRAAIRG